MALPDPQLLLARQCTCVFLMAGTAMSLQANRSSTQGAVSADTLETLPQSLKELRLSAEQREGKEPVSVTLGRAAAGPLGLCCR